MSFQKLIIHAQFGSDDQAMLVFDLDCSTPVRKIRTAVLIAFLEETGIEHQLVTVLGKGHGFEVDGFWWALLFSIVISLIHLFTARVFRY